MRSNYKFAILPKPMQKIITLICCLLPCIISSAQTGDFKKIEVEEIKNVISSMELSPDGSTVAIGTAKGPVFLFDPVSQKVIRKIDVEGFYAGPRMQYSHDGKYLLMLQQFYVDWNLNKDKPARTDVLDVASGKIVFTKDKIHSASLSPDCKTIAYIEANDIKIADVQSGNVLRSLHVDGLTNAIAISPDGKYIVASHKPTVDDVKDFPTFRNDKKAIKEMIRYREIISWFDFETLKKLRTTTDVLDIVYGIRFSTDGRYMFVYNVANTKLQDTKGLRQGYLNKIDSGTGEVMREIFSTNALEPDFKNSPGGYFFGTTSLQMKNRMVTEVLVSDMKTARMINRFEVGVSLFEGVMLTDRTAFVFLPDNKTILLAYGNQLALWNFMQ